ncbi:hypothetical protein FRC08_016163 [Ceratobasidium sp. 394]|nr:hypothetical protein FRC08_016163 [Ceratobasidium sp. 394]
MHFLNQALSLLSLLALVYAQDKGYVPVGGQCGGKGWTGPTLCQVGTYCRPIRKDYWVCVPIPPTPDPPASTLSTITPSHPVTTTSGSATPTYYSSSSSTTTFTSVSCKNVVRDEQHKRWTCAPNPSTTSTTFEHTTPTPLPTTTTTHA